MDETVRVSAGGTVDYASHQVWLQDTAAASKWYWVCHCIWASCTFSAFSLQQSPSPAHNLGSY